MKFQFCKVEKKLKRRKTKFYDNFRLFWTIRVCFQYLLFNSKSFRNHDFKVHVWFNYYDHFIDCTFGLLRCTRL